MDNNTISPAIKYYRMLWKNRILIFIVSLVVGIASTIYSLYAVDVQFKSTVNLVPPNSSSGAFENILSNVGGALKNIGLKSLGGGGSGGDNFEYMVILESRTVIDSMIRKYDLIHRYDLQDEDYVMRETRKEFMDNVSLEYHDEGNYMISVWDISPDTAAIMANDYVEIANGVAAKIEKDEAIFNLKYMEKRLEVLDSAYLKIADSLRSFSNKYKVFSFEDQAKEYSKAFSELKSKELMLEMYYDMSKDMYGEDDYKTKMQENLLTGIRSKIVDVETKPGFVGGLNLQSAAEIGVEYAKLYSSFEAFSKFRAILLPMIEKSRLDANKAVKNLFVLDQAIAAEKKDRPKRLLIVIGSVFGSIIFMVFFILIYDTYKSIIGQIKND